MNLAHLMVLVLGSVREFNSIGVHLLKKDKKIPRNAVNVVPSLKLLLRHQVDNLIYAQDKHKNLMCKQFHSLTLFSLIHSLYISHSPSLYLGQSSPNKAKLPKGKNPLLIERNLCCKRAHK